MSARGGFAALVVCATPVLLSACSRQKSPSALSPSSAPSSSASPQTCSRVPKGGGATNPGFKLVRPGETTTEIAQRAREILDANSNAPIGTEVPFEVDGRAYVGRIEEHCHEPGGPKKPWGRHRGVTLYHAD